MAEDIGEGYGDDGELGRALRALPRYAAPAHLRHALAVALAPEPPPRVRVATWLSPALSALAAAMIMVLWIAPSLPTAVPPDPLRPVTRALLNAHARTVLWGESRSDVVPVMLPWAMNEGGVFLNWVFAGDDDIHLVNAEPIYMEGRRGIELAYRDIDGHTVTYLILPLPTLALPERGRVQIDRWRPLVRRENGFSMVLWKQQEHLCALVSDLVSEGDFAKLKEYFVKVRSSTEPSPVY